MKQAFGFDFAIPFADGLTDNRESSLEKMIQEISSTLMI